VRSESHPLHPVFLAAIGVSGLWVTSGCGLLSDPAAIQRDGAPLGDEGSTRPGGPSDASERIDGVGSSHGDSGTFESGSDAEDGGGAGGTCPVLADAAGQDSGAPVVLAEGKFPQGLAVDGTGVYWADAEQGTVMKVSLQGGTPVTLASRQANPEAVAVDETSVYWTDEGWGCQNGSTGQDAESPCPFSVVKIKKEGGVPVTLTSGQNNAGEDLYLDNPAGIVVDETSVYWTNPSQDFEPVGTVMSVPKGGGAPITLASGQGITPAIAVDSDNVYWTSETFADAGLLVGLVMSVPKGGGTPVTLVETPNIVSSMTVGVNRVYWASTVSPNVNAILSVPTKGGTPTTLVSGSVTASFDNPTGLVIDDGNIYWVGSSGIMKMPLEGGTPTTVANVGLGEGTFVVYCRGVYFTAFLSLPGSGVIGTIAR
jgi:hypothetical protein